MSEILTTPSPGTRCIRTTRLDDDLTVSIPTIVQCQLEWGHEGKHSWIVVKTWNDPRDR